MNQENSNLGSQTQLNSKKNQLVLLSDLPSIGNIHIKRAFHDALRKVARSSRCRIPVVILLTEIRPKSSDDMSKFNDLNAFLLHNIIPKDVLFSPAFGQIKCVFHLDLARIPNSTKSFSFNPVAQTFVNKALSRIVELQFRSPSMKKKKPSKTQLDEMAKQSGGDIRFAINTLQFYRGRRPAQSLTKYVTTVEFCFGKTRLIRMLIKYRGTRFINSALSNSGKAYLQ
jgi:hypothetical protein